MLITAFQNRTSALRSRSSLLQATRGLVCAICLTASAAAFAENGELHASLTQAAPQTTMQSPSRARPTATEPSMRTAALELVERRLKSQYSDIKHISSMTLESLLRIAPERVVLLDVRGDDEYVVSHMPGAVQIAPYTRSARDVAMKAGGLEGKIVIAYCSIGVRSSRMLTRISQALREQGAFELYNLEGGLFRWRNEKRALVDSTGPTSTIHPYNMIWRQFLVDDPAGRSDQFSTAAAD